MIKQKGEDWSTLSRRQKVGYFVVRLLGAIQQWIYHRVIGERVWRTAEGKCIPISKIGNGHLDNIIKMLMRDPESDPHVLRKMFRERDRRRREWTKK